MKCIGVACADFSCAYTPFIDAACLHVPCLDVPCIGAADFACANITCAACIYCVAGTKEGFIPPSTSPIGDSARIYVARDNMDRGAVEHSDVGRGGVAQRTASRRGISTGDVTRGVAGRDEARTLDDGGP